MAFVQIPILSHIQENLQNQKSVMWQLGENLCRNKLIISMNPHSFKKGVNSLRSSTQNWTAQPCPKLLSTFIIIRTQNLINCRLIHKTHENTVQRSGTTCFEIYIWKNKQRNSQIEEEKSILFRYTLPEFSNSDRKKVFRFGSYVSIIYVFLEKDKPSWWTFFFFKLYALQI